MGPNILAGSTPKVFRAAKRIRFTALSSSTVNDGELNIRRLAYAQALSGLCRASARSRMLCKLLALVCWVT